jgi:hypothetical protein
MVWRGCTTVACLRQRRVISTTAFQAACPVLELRCCRWSSLSWQGCKEKNFIAGKTGLALVSVGILLLMCQPALLRRLTLRSVCVHIMHPLCRHTTRLPCMALYIKKVRVPLWIDVYRFGLICCVWFGLTHPVPSTCFKRNRIQTSTWKRPAIDFLDLNTQAECS